MSTRRRDALLACLCLAATGVAGCGSGDRQDEGESDRAYDVEVTQASFPERHRLGQKSELVIGVKNSDSEAIPDVAVTVHGFFRRLDNDALSDKRRPVFLLNSVYKQIGGYPEVKLAGPEGGETALVDTWTLGRLRPGAEKTFRWKVTAVRPGPFQVTYAVAGGLNGGATTKDVNGDEAHGAFDGTVVAAAPASRVGADGVTVVSPAP